jgi:tetratricopeptide (TPR) repeat protein
MVVNRQVIYNSSQLTSQPDRGTSIREIPPPAHDFTNRDTQLETLLQAVRQDKYSIIGLFGMQGVGKTQLGSRLSFMVSDTYLDQLYLELKGTSNSPMPAHEALAYVICKVSPNAVLPCTLDELRKLYRSVLYDKRVLIFLDDAADAEQVRHLVPPPSCLLLFTAQKEFYLDGMKLVRLPLLSEADAIQFLQGVDNRIGEQAIKIAVLCGFLPFALRYAAQTIKARRDLPVSRYVQRLETNSEQRLALVDPVIRTSYDLLTPSERKQRWCALACFADKFERHAAAAVWDLPENQAEDLLGWFCTQNMVLFNETLEQYYLHDLARLFGNNHLEHQEVYLRRHAAYFLRYARQHRHPLPLLDRVATDVFSAYDWCEAERERQNRPSLMAVIQDLLDTDERGAGEVIYLIARLFKRTGRFKEALLRYQECLEVAQASRIPSLEGACLRSLSEIYDAQGETTVGDDKRNRALQTLRAAADPDSQIELIFTLHLCSEQCVTQGDIKGAEKWACESLKVRDGIPAEHRDRNAGLSNGAIKLIAFLLYQEKYDEAIRLLNEERTNLIGVCLASTLGQVGCALRDVGRYREAATLFDEAFQTYDSISVSAGTSWIKRCQGELHAQQGQFEQASACYDQALRICQGELEPYQIAIALLDLARFHYGAKNPSEGDRYRSEYAKLQLHVEASPTNSKVKVAAALTALAQALQPLGQAEKAAAILEEARALHDEVTNAGPGLSAVQRLGDRWGCEPLSLAWPGGLRLPKSR